MEKKNIRYVLSFMNKEGMRQMAAPMQGRNTYGSKKEAEAYRTAFLKNNNPDTLKSIFGSECMGTFEVSAIECYPGHNDPKGCWIQDGLNPGQETLSEVMKKLVNEVMTMVEGNPEI